MSSSSVPDRRRAGSCGHRHRPDGAAGRPAGRRRSRPRLQL